MSNPNGINCPYCGCTHSSEDSDVYRDIVTYYGQSHEFSCFECDADFIVVETVTREFEVQKT